MYIKPFIKENDMTFVPETTDFTLSPYTGLTRESWLEAARYLMEFVFKNIKDMDSPMVLPRQDYTVSYPNDSTPPWKVQAEYFEGLTRTFFIAAPLIREDPRITLNGFSLREYYKKQILKSVTPGDECYVLSYEEMHRQYGEGNPYAHYQQTVETCALVICLDICREAIWESYTREERDRIAGFLAEYAKSPTVPQNWRLFNMLDYGFLYKYGYPIDEDIMRDHAQAILQYYAGDGWYRDGYGFDYYSCWAFNTYTAFWNEWYGYEKEPYLAAKFEEYSNELMKTYPHHFDRDGFTNMWGRSGIYRFAATSAFDANCMMRNPTLDPGLARRIASGSLLQFLGREDFLYKGIPTLGFYKQFLPLVQSYSCAASPYWMGKAFLCLCLPPEHPFWSSKEHNGFWERMEKEEVRTLSLDGPGLCVTNHAASGITEMRTGKVSCDKEDLHKIWNYAKLAYNTKFPWEASNYIEYDSQQYTVLEKATGNVLKANATLWHGERGGILYRRQFCGYRASGESCWLTAFNLADFSVPYGLLRVDKLRTCRNPIEITLGSYGFPDQGQSVTGIQEREKNGFKAIVLKGRDFTGKEKQLAMTIFDGWDSLEIQRSTGTNPDSDQSIVLVAKTRREKLYGYEKYCLISQVITKESHEDFSEEELFPIREIQYTDKENCGGYGPIRIHLISGSIRTVDYTAMEGRLVV